MDKPSLFTDTPAPRVVKFPFRLSPEEREALGDAARARGVNPTRLLRMALRAFIVDTAPQEHKRKKAG